MKRVRRELFGDKDAAIATISRFGITFSSGCISLLKKPLALKCCCIPTSGYLPLEGPLNATKRYSVEQSRDPAQELSHVIYELMGWQRDWKYKVTANYFTKADEQVIIFDLNCCEFRFRNSARGQAHKGYSQRMAI